MRHNYKQPQRKTTQEYLLRLAGETAKRCIQIKLNDYDYDTKIKPDVFRDEFRLSSIEDDHRITDKVFRELIEAGALKRYHSFRPRTRYSWSGSPKPERKVYMGIVNEEWFSNKTLPLAVAPKFETSGIVTVTKDTWSKQKIRETKTEFENYKKINHYNEFTDAEYVYVWFHLDEYDIKQITEKGKFSDQKTTYNSIYPKALLTDLSKGVYEGHAEHYVEKNIPWAMNYLLGIEKDRVINNLNMSTPPTPKCKIEKFEEWTEDNVTLQLERISCLQTLLTMCQKSFTQLLSKVEVYGGWDKFRERSKQEFLTYLENNFPLHIGDDEPDEELRKLSQWVAEGKNKGFNERLQAIEKGALK